MAKLYKQTENEFHPKHREQSMLRHIQTYKADAYIRKGNFSTEIVYGKRSYMFPAKAKDNEPYKKGLFLFGMVRRDAKAFLRTKKKPHLPKRYPVNETNNRFDKWEYRITGTDLNHAYWRIAYNIGIITKQTYEKGLPEAFKVVRLAALSTLGSGKDYFVIKKGVITDDIVKVGADPDLSDLYKVIRYTCYRYMQEMKRTLGDDFVAYRTDCIYYTDTPENRKMIRDFCKEKHLSFKQLYGDKSALYTEGTPSNSPAI